MREIDDASRPDWQPQKPNAPGTTRRGIEEVADRKEGFRGEGTAVAIVGLPAEDFNPEVWAA